MQERANKSSFYMSTIVKHVEYDASNSDHVELRKLLVAVHSDKATPKIRRRANMLAKRIGFETVHSHDFMPYKRLSCAIWFQTYDSLGQISAREPDSRSPRKT